SVLAHGDDALVLVQVALHAVDRLVADQRAQLVRGLCAARPVRRVARAMLPALGRIDTEQTDARGPDFERVAVDDLRSPGECLGLVGTERRRGRDRDDQHREQGLSHAYSAGENRPNGSSERRRSRRDPVTKRRTPAAYVAVQSRLAKREAGRQRSFMLVTFRTKAHADITMFGHVGVELLKLAGMTGHVPTAILAADVPGVLAKLESALGEHRAAFGDAAPSASETSGGNGANDNETAEPAVPLRNRALPLLELLRAAVAAKTDVVVSARG